MKTLKITGVVLAIIVVLLLAAIAIITLQFDGARMKAEAEKFVLDKKQRTLKIDSDLKLSFWPNVGANLGKVSLSEHKSDQQFATIDAARISVALIPLLSKKIVVNDVQLKGLQATVVKRKDGTLNIADLLSSKEEEAAPEGGKPAAGGAEPLQIDVAGISIANAALSWKNEQDGTATSISGLDLHTGRVQFDGARKAFQLARLSLAVMGKIESPGGTDTFDVKLAAPNLAVSPEKSHGEGVTLAAVLTGPQRKISVNLALSGIDGNADAFNIGQMVLDLDGQANQTAVKGRLAGAIVADLGRQTLDLEKIEGNFDVSDPQMPMKQLRLPLTGTLHADLEKQSAQGALSTLFDESKIGLKFDVTKFTPLALNFALDLDKFNLDRYLPPAKAERKATAKTVQNPAAAGDEKLDFSPLKGPTVTGSVSLGEFQAHNLKAEQIRLQMHLTDGRLEVAPLSARLYGGSLNGELALDANGNGVVVRQNLVGVNLGPLIKDAVNQDILEGRGNTALDVNMHGMTVAQMKRALAGTASLALRDGAIKGIDLAHSLRDLKEKLGARQDQAIANQATDKTEFSELSATFKINAGVAHNDDLSAKSPFLRLAGNGDIDIGESRLNYLLKASIVAAAAGQGAKDLGQLAGITVPVRLSGPFDEPSWKIEFSGLASEAAKEKVAEARQKAQEQVKEKLKGLLPH